jgi:dihydropteroate synthase
MGILNVTPDSFSDGGLFVGVEEAVAHGARLADEGADIVDVGGESTRPGADDVPVRQELDRVVPVVEGLCLARPDVLVSVDTRRAIVAEAAIDAGACIVNDVSGGRDPSMLGAVARTGVGYVLMHMLGEPRTMQADPQYEDVVREVREFLRERVEAALFAGANAEQLAVDPGIGFGKTMEHNVALLRALGRFGDLDAAVLVGASRKRFLGTLTGVEDAAARLEGSLAAAVVAALAGADVVRVHDVEPTIRALAVADAVRLAGA